MPKTPPADTSDRIGRKTREVLQMRVEKALAAKLGAKEWMNVCPNRHQLLLVRQVVIPAGSPHPRLHAQRGARDRNCSGKVVEAVEDK